jgi:hypothetical protein
MSVEKLYTPHKVFHPSAIRNRDDLSQNLSLIDEIYVVSRIFYGFKPALCFLYFL